MTPKLARLVLVLIGAFLCAGPIFGANTLVIQEATIVDVRDGSRSENMTIVVSEDRITFIGKEVPPASVNARTIDAGGKWVVPGFIDVHVHDASETYLRSMLAWGVTAIQLMPNHPPESPTGIERKSESARTLSPRLQITAMFAREFPDNLVPGLYRFEKPKGEAEAREAVRRLHDRGYRQIKIVQDDSRLWSGDGSVVAPLEWKVFDALVSEAHARGMRVYVHTTQRDHSIHAIEAGLDAFMHGTMDAPLEAEQWRKMAERRTAWTPAYHALYWYGDRRAFARRVLADPRLTDFLPSGRVTDLRSQARSDSPLVLEAMQPLVDHTEAYTRTIGANTRMAVNAGVPVAVGSDGGPAGISTHLEMELLQENGLSPGEVLAAATYGGAVAMGRQGEMGSVEAGKLADLVILNADPMLDVRNCRRIQWIIKGGLLYTQQELTPDLE